MFNRSVGFAVFVFMSAVLGAILLFQSPGPGPSADPGRQTPSTPAGPVAKVPPPPLSDLDDVPLTEEERARGIRRIPGGGRVDFRNKTLTVPALVCLRNGLVELFACAEGGKEHESIVMLRCRPELLNLNLTLFGLKKGSSRSSDPADIQGDRVMVFCEWENDDGKTVSVRAEDLIWNQATNRPMDPVGWTYVGSHFVPETDNDTGKPTGRKVFAAVYGRTIIATFDDASALLNTPLPEGVDDTAFVVNEKVVPPSETPMRMVLRPATPEEMAEIRKVESQLDEQRKQHKPKGKRREEAKPGEAPPGGVPPGADQ